MRATNATDVKWKRIDLRDKGPRLREADGVKRGRHKGAPYHAEIRRGDPRGRPCPSVRRLADTAEMGVIECVGIFQSVAGRTIHADMGEPDDRDRGRERLIEGKPR